VTTIAVPPAPSSVLRPARFGLPDVAVILGALALLAVLAKVGAGAFVAFVPPQTLPGVDLDPHHLPYYAARSTLRMFIALVASLAFTLAYGYAAARNRYAERVLVPLLDILQSVPVLGFLSITVTGFIALFPGSLLGLEAAAIFAIFTSQAWNMAFSFYQSLRTLPQDLSEASTSYGLPLWQRFVRLEVPAAMLGLVWNAMMSFGGGWFFLAASEAISVLNRQYTLPGIGSYVAAAVAAKDMPALGYAVLTMAVVIVAVDQLFWRPLVAWSDKFRLDQSAAAHAPQSWVYDLLRSARVTRVVGRLWTPGADAVSGVLSALTRVGVRGDTERPSAMADRVFNAALIVLIPLLVAFGLRFILDTVGFGELLKVAGLGALTLLRVLVLLVFATVVWTPIGVAIGLNPRLAQRLQPVALICASFPANFIFPFATLAFITFHIPINVGSVALMALGAQWYILFNVIAGAASIPTDLREMTVDLGLHGWSRWRRLIIPGIFSSWVTGAITASGGAWNASIVSEVVTWGATTLTAADHAWRRDDERLRRHDQPHALAPFVRARGKEVPAVTAALIQVEGCCKAFPLPEGNGEFTVLQDVDLHVAPKEVLALLGRSGSGKSTLLRIMAGLIPPSSGGITSGGKTLRGANADVAMVFQSFALLPWLTVIENVELGLEARGVGRTQRTKRALKAIDQVGLDGFESAYPRELSGGMKQRVGFARALVVEPRVLFLDEPFSALDVLTAENLRGEIDELWNAGTFPAESILIVTHNIEEAVFLADRVIVLGANPGRIRGEVRIDLPRPHDRNDARFHALVEHLYAIMTNPTMDVAVPQAVDESGVPPLVAVPSPYARPLPHVRVGTISGLLELLVETTRGSQEIARLAERLALPVDDLYFILEATAMLGFATVAEGNVSVTDAGREFATATIQQSKEIFRRQVLAHAPIVATIAKTLASKENKTMRSDFFLDVLEEHFPAGEAKQQFATAVDWGRYAELFEYDAPEERLLAGS
jgi:NitT/TauT family transport system permease protein